MILINGEEKSCIEVSDRGFQYGDGVFETIEIANGLPFFLSAHLERLRSGCARLGIAAPDVEKIATEARAVAKSLCRGVLKIIVTRGSGGRGYRPPDHPQPTRVLTAYPMPEQAADFGRRGIRAILCKTRLGSNPALAGIKHMNRLEQILARSEWNTEDAQEGLMLDEESYVIEGTMSNLFMVKKGRLYTPLLDRCGVAGIVRAVVIENAQRAGAEVKMVRLDTATLLEADELFLTNSIIGLWPITQFLERRYTIGPLTREAVRWLEESKARELWVP